MTMNRFSIENIADEPRQGAFMFIPVAAAAPAPVSPLQWMYQKLFEQASQVKQQPKATRDLFAVMN